MTNESFLAGNAVAFTLISFSSYFDVYSHAHLFIGVDPWWNPAHLMLYLGFIVLGVTLWKSDRRDGAVRLSFAGFLISVTAAAFNEAWHRVLLFGNPLPEPFPIEPPHALLAIGIVVSGAAAPLFTLEHRGPSNLKSRAAIAAVSGSLWLIVAGSAFYAAGAYGTYLVFLFAAGVAGFSGALFLRYPAGTSGRFGFATLSFLWFMAVYYLFFLTPADGFPLGLVLVLLADYVMSSGKHAKFGRIFVIAAAGLLYGLLYFPILPASFTLALNGGLAAATLGAVGEYGLEVFVLSRVAH